MITSLIFDQAFLAHRTGAGNPECAGLISATVNCPMRAGSSDQDNV